ncbi:MAG: phosphoribosyltransferase family protein [Ardenticatenaceae bacterium]|nr:phosphoribosyltransferase family protein [Ardenticatenaceae bacterium]
MINWENVVIMDGGQIWEDRQHAGRELAVAVEQHLQPDGTPLVVFGIPRGGLLVAAPVARALDTRLDLIVPKKLGAPGQPELAIGAVTERGRIFLNRELVEWLGVSDEYIAAEAHRQMVEIERRVARYRRVMPAAKIEAAVVVLVDDGVATGATMMAAIHAVRADHPARVVVALPVAPRETLEELAGLADQVIALSAPVPFFGSVGSYYGDFSQVGDEELLAILRQFAPSPS